MRRSGAEVYWRHLMGHELTEYEIQQLIYLPKNPWEGAYTPNGLPTHQPDMFGSDTEPEPEPEPTAAESAGTSAAALPIEDEPQDE